MGVSFLNTARIILSQPEPEFVEELRRPTEKQTYQGHRVPAAHYFGETPLYVEWVSECGTHIQVTSEGYGVFDFGQMEFPASLNGIVSMVRPCQSDDIDYVISADNEEIEDGFDWSPYEEAREDDYFNFEDQMPEIDWDLPDEEIDKLTQAWDKQKDEIVNKEWERHLSFFPEPQSRS